MDSSSSSSSSSSDTAMPSNPSSPSYTIRNRGSKYLQSLASQNPFDDLQSALDGYQAIANYCLGGTIPISTTSFNPTQHNSDFSSSKAPITSPPITLRFDTASGATHKVTFPLPPLDPNSAVNRDTREYEDLEKLLEACSPTTFGSDGKDVLNETYRKTGKLDHERFSTNFHPADCGILDAVRQALLPGFRLESGSGSEGGKGREEHWGVRAELEKLNVYSAPSSRFQKHVDTPKGATQFGSLVIYLPYPHEGGQLLISHKNHESTFDWSITSSSPPPTANSEVNSLKWSAFYSDCEHEVLPVTNGHRVTLTYNLFVSESVGGILQRFPTAQPAMYPLFKGARQTLEMPGFMSEGGTLGFYCVHQYAHTRKITEQLMPYSLKGIDAVLFSVFSSLGVNVVVRPVMGEEAWDEHDEWLAEGGFREGRQAEFAADQDLDEEESYEDWKARQPIITRVGNRFRKLVMAGEVHIESGDDPAEKIAHRWPLEQFADVCWLNSGIHEGWDIAMVNMKCGNESSLMWHYSHAAILINIPPRGERIPIPKNGFWLPDWSTGQRGFDDVSTSA